MREQLKWYDEKAHNSPWLDALAELRQQRVGLDLGGLAGMDGDDVVLVHIDLRFHRGILAAGRNPLLLQMGNLIGVGLLIGPGGVSIYGGRSRAH